MVSHLRSEAYRRQRQQVYRPNPDPADRTVEKLERSIESSRRRLGW